MIKLLITRFISGVTQNALLLPHILWAQTDSGASASLEHNRTSPFFGGGFVPHSRNARFFLPPDQTGSSCFGRP